MRLFVGGLNYSTTEAELKAFFESASDLNVVEATVIKDRDTQKSKGFGFVVIDTSRTEKQVCEEFNGQRLMGRNVTVNVATPKTPKGAGAGHGGGGRRY